MRYHIAIATLLMGACAGSQNQEPGGALHGVESKIEVCVIDTVAPGGMMAIGAVRVHATNDTLVMQSVGRVPLREIVRGPRVLAEAKWISPRTPLQLNTASGRVRFLRTGQPKVFAQGRLILLGMMRGVPIFALPAEAGAMRPEIEALAARGIDLETALSQRVSLRRQMSRVNALYIPVSLTGCTFQKFAKSRPRRR